MDTIAAVGLVSAVLGFFARKVGMFALLVASMFLGIIVLQVLIPPLQDAFANHTRLEGLSQRLDKFEAELAVLKKSAAEGREKTVDSLTKSVNAEVKGAKTAVTKKRADVKRLSKSEDNVCGFWKRLTAKVAPGDACKAARKAAQSADQALTTVEGNLRDAEKDAAILGDPDLTAQEKLERLGTGIDRSKQRQISNKEAEIAQTKSEQNALQKSQKTWSGRIASMWAASWKWVAAVALFLMLGPVLARIVGYFMLMPWVSRVQKPIRLSSDTDHSGASVDSTDASRTLVVRLAPGEKLSARSEHVRPVVGSAARSNLLYDWKSPFISFAAGLHGLSRLDGGDDGTEATLATPDDPSAYLMRIDFKDHPGLVMRPTHVVGVIGSPGLDTMWRWGVHSLATWQVRYIMFSGSGSLIVQGSGDVVATNPGGKPTKIEQNLLMGFDTRLSLGVSRTEVFWPYVFGRTPLVDDQFTGQHSFFWQKSTVDSAANPAVKAVSVFFSAIGKVLGF